MPAVANSHLTAISRRGPSAPCRWLFEQGRLVGHVLDWGCGRGADVEFLQGSTVCYGFDPHWRNKLPPGWLEFDSVLLTYVLNTVPGFFCRAEIIHDAIAWLKPGGKLYVSIRCNPKELNGWTKRGTWQGYVGDDLRRGGFTLLRKTGDYEIWEWHKIQRDYEEEENPPPEWYAPPLRVAA